MKTADHILRRRRRCADGAMLDGAKVKFLIMSLAVITGAAIGAVLIQRGYAVYYINGLFEDFISLRQSRGFISVFLNSLGSALLLLISVFISGISAVGVPVSFAALIYKGLGFGMICGYLYAVFGSSGLLFSAVIIIPYAFVSSVALILACRESFGLSIRIFSQLLPEAKYIKLWGDLKTFCKRYAVILLITVAASFMDALLAKIFISLISL